MRSLLLVPLLLVACKSTPEATPDPKPTGVTTAVTELVTLKRGACFGRCPIYVVKVMSDGAVAFEGERFVATVGKATGALDAAALEKLTQRLDASGFAGWKAAYTDRRMTDMSTVELTVRGRTVVHYLGDDTAPEGLKQLEDDVDALVGTAQWIAGAVQ